MSVHRLQLEQQLRGLEAEDEARARAIRAEIAADVPDELLWVRRPRRHVPHRTPRLLLLAKDGRSLCADYLLGWWRRRSSFNGLARPVSTNEINRLAGILRRLE